MPQSARPLLIIVCKPCALRLATRRNGKAATGLHGTVSPQESQVIPESCSRMRSHPKSTGEETRGRNLRLSVQPVPAWLAYSTPSRTQRTAHPDRG